MDGRKKYRILQVTNVPHLRSLLVAESFESEGPRDVEGLAADSGRPCFVVLLHEKIPLVVLVHSYRAIASDAVSCVLSRVVRSSKGGGEAGRDVKRRSCRLLDFGGGKSES